MNLRDENGQAMVMTALSMGILLGFMALAVDTGILFHAKRKLQTAADAAATAGALDYLYNSSIASAQATARAASSANGYTDGTDNVSVTVNAPAVGGPNAGTAGTVEVIVSKSVPMTFMTLAGVSNMTVMARAVAGVPNTGSTCVWLMDPGGVGLQLQGNYNIQAPQCGIYVNSTSPSAVTISGNDGTLNALYAATAGGVVGGPTNPTQIGSNPAPRKSPWGNLNGPNPSSGSGCTTLDSTTTMISGNVTGAGAGNSICYTQAVTLNNATIGSGSLGPSISTSSVSSPAGTLVFGNGVTISGTVTVFGGTLDIYSGSFDQGDGLLNILSPTSGSYNGVALLQPAGNANQLQVDFGHHNQVFDGYIYAPGAQVYPQDYGHGSTALGIVADSLLEDSLLRIPNYDKAHPATTLNRVPALIE